MRRAAALRDGRAVEQSRVRSRGRSAVPWTRRSAQTARFTGSSATAAAGNPDHPGCIVGPGRCGPASFSNHIDLPLGTGPLDRLCQKGRVTSLHNHKGHRHVRVRRDFVKYAHLAAMQEKIRDAAFFFLKKCNACPQQRSTGPLSPADARKNRPSRRHFASESRRLEGALEKFIAGLRRCAPAGQGGSGAGPQRAPAPPPG
jgi:hypothetical protein